MLLYLSIVVCVLSCIIVFIAYCTSTEDMPDWYLSVTGAALIYLILYASWIIYRFILLLVSI